MRHKPRLTDGPGGVLVLKTVRLSEYDFKGECLNIGCWLRNEPHRP